MQIRCDSFAISIRPLRPSVTPISTRAVAAGAASASAGATPCCAVLCVRCGEGGRHISSGASDGSTARFSLLGAPLCVLMAHPLAACMRLNCWR